MEGHWPRAGVNGGGWEGWSLKKEWGKKEVHPEGL